MHITCGFKKRRFVHNFHGNIIGIGFPLDNVQFLKKILDIRQSLMKYEGCDDNFFVPLQCIHVTLAQFELPQPITCKDISNRISKALENTADILKNEDLNISPSVLLYGEQSESIKIYFSKETTEKIRSWKDILVRCMAEQDFQYRDTRSFVPHVTIFTALRGASLNEEQKENIKGISAVLQRDYQHRLDRQTPSKLQVLQPRGQLGRTDKERTVIRAASRLQVNLTSRPRRRFYN